MATKQPVDIDIEELLNKAPVETTVDILTDYDLARDIPNAERALVEAKSDLRYEPKDPERKAAVSIAEAELKALRTRATKATVRFRLRAQTRVAYEALRDAHGPTPEDEKEGVGWNKGFIPALIAATVVEPKMTLDQATRLVDSWSAAEVNDIFMACFWANNRRPVVDLGKDWPTTRGTERKSATA